MGSKQKPETLHLEVHGTGTSIQADKRSYMEQDTHVTPSIPDSFPVLSRKDQKGSLSFGNAGVLLGYQPFSIYFAALTSFLSSHIDKDHRAQLSLPSLLNTSPLALTPSQQ